MQISLESVSKSYKKEAILESVSLEILAGERLAIFGRNGSGKTTLLKLILGLITQTSGNIVRSKDILITFVSNNPRSFFYRLSPLQNLIFFSNLYCDLSANEIMKRINFLVEHLDLNYIMRKKVMDLSGGEIKKLMLVRALVPNPDIILLDELFSNIDRESIIKISDFLLKEFLIEEEKSLIMTSHHRDECKKICKNFIKIENKQTTQKELL
ncbi:MAG: hypothetical protein CMG64_07610 [Candidatus Marinimicrobia bacterium]|nr:hypothetical protein [Candidatus Neomarinimicrobiota bacterium]|tara:strand:+ start:256 stop:891 length:636 start_codon:yes stop_codon:yes gene_type:complete